MTNFVVPAHAGVILSAGCISFAPSGSPRTRGGDPTIDAMLAATAK